MRACAHARPFLTAVRPHCSALTAIAASERVVLKKTLDSLPDYGVFLNQITVFLFILLFAGIVWYKQRVRALWQRMHCCLTCAHSVPTACVLSTQQPSLPPCGASPSTSSR